MTPRTTLRNRILIALLAVPVIAAAGPRTTKKAKKVDEPAPAQGSGASTPTTPAANTPTPQAAGTAPATPSAPAQPAPPQTPAGAGGGSATPPADDTKTKADKPAGDDTAGKDAPDVDTLRQEYLALRDELFKSRARANAVAGQLYSTRMTVRFTWGSARYYGVTKASIRLDGATVYEDATGAIAGDDGVRFDGFVAPGRHLVTFHVEASGKDDDSFTSTTETQIVVKAVANKDLLVTAKGHDNGDIAYAWKKGEHGSYGLGIDVGVKTAVAPAGRSESAPLHSGAGGKVAK
jgi:hypothetical protein